jgi:hypothetical protein
MYLWRLHRLADGNMEQLADNLHAEKYNWVNVKVVEGQYIFNEYEKDGDQIPLLDVLAPLLEERGIELHVWGYHYGTTILGWDWTHKEIPCVLQMLGRYGKWVRSYTINAEGEFKTRPGRNTAAQNLCIGIKDGMAVSNDSIPDVPILLCAARFPSLHLGLPWATFLKYVDAVAPMMYWEGAHNPAQQLQRCIREYRELTDVPIIPAGSAYPNSSIGWKPTVEEFNDFDQAAKDAGLLGVCWWEYEYLERNPDWRKAIALHEWSNAEPTPGPAPEEPDEDEGFDAGWNALANEVDVRLGKLREEIKALKRG